MKTARKVYRMNDLFPVIILITGLFLLVFKIYADSEPGAIPLFLLLVGSVWLFVSRFKRKNQNP